MTDRPHNSNDPEFLLSRAIDESLAEPDQSRIAELMAGSAELRQADDGLRAVDALVKRWGDKKAAYDEAAFVDRVSETISGEFDAEDLEEVDELIARWAAHGPEVDWEKFEAGVTGRIKPAGSVRSLRRVIFRIGAPLAAAAAIVMAVSIGLNRPASPEPVPDPVVAWGPEYVVIEPEPVEVLFDRDPGDYVPPADPAPRIGIASIGIAVVSAEAGE